MKKMSSMYENGEEIERRREARRFYRTLGMSPIKAPPRPTLDKVAAEVEKARAKIALLTGFDVSKVTLQVEFLE
jgi:hypothetical protein